MNIRTSALLAIAFALPPNAASAINCEFGCKGSDCDMPQGLTELIGGPLLSSYQGYALALPSLSLTAFSPSGSGQNACDQVIAGAMSDDGWTHALVGRDTTSFRLARSRVDFDLRQVRANVDPGNGARSWWPGMVTWFVTLDESPGVGELRLDYSGGFVAPWLHYQPILRLVFDELVLVELAVQSTQIAAQLEFTAAGDTQVVIAEFAEQSTDHAEMPLRQITIDVPGVAHQHMNLPGLSLGYIQLGRRGNAFERRSTGILTLASHLVTVDEGLHDETPMRRDAVR